MRCFFCDGVAHPATGCQYTENAVACGPCVRDAWRWIKGFTNQKGRRRGPAFYDHVNRIAAPISVEEELVSEEEEVG
jgi:hypothetical protein